MSNLIDLKHPIFFTIVMCFSFNKCLKALDLKIKPFADAFRDDLIITDICLSYDAILLLMNACDELV